jgi:homocysteine S-methyltransferase
VFAPPHDTVLVADASLATESEARSHDVSDDLWSALLLVDAPAPSRESTE